VDRGAVCPLIYTAGGLGFATEPDGLWLAIGDEPKAEASSTFADCMIIEVCGTRQNLFDKRSRYASRTDSLVVDIRHEWLDEEIPTRGRGGPRRSRREVLRHRLPEDGVIRLPVRHVRVLYALPDPLFLQVARGLPMQAFEFLCPYPRPEQFNAQVTQSFLQRMAPSQSIFPTRNT
jgi:hypothetical protein